MTGTCPLWARYNGGMLGFFLSGAPAEFARARYPVLAGRMNQFLEEIGVAPDLPADPPDHAAMPALAQRVMQAVLARQPEVGKVTLTTALAHHAVLQRFADRATAEACGAMARSHLQGMGLDPAMVDRFAAAVEMDGDGIVRADPLFSAGLDFLKGLIAPLPVSRTTAFVAMPFAPPHDAYFASFYAPVLRELRLTAIRAWGGLGSESYQEIMHLLIEKSAAVLADLTTLNINVVHEIGVAEGRGKRTFLLAAKDEVIPPSNLGDLAIWHYDRAAPGWEAEAIRVAATGFSLGVLGAELGEGAPDG